MDARRWLLVEAGKPLRAEAFTPRAPGPGEVLVRVAGCGVCHTDLGYYYDGVRTNAPLPLALGHEISGHVVAAGTGAEAWLGKAVIIPNRDHMSAVGDRHTRQAVTDFFGA